MFYYHRRHVYRKNTEAFSDWIIFTESQEQKTPQRHNAVFNPNTVYDIVFGYEPFVAA